MIPTFDYINPTTACDQARFTDGDRTVVVMGNPDDFAYEWLIFRDGKVESHSNKCYGSVGVALRDGLIELYGAPD